MGDVGDAELAQGDLVGGVRDGGVGEPVGVLLNDFGVGVDADHLPVLADQFQREGAAEAAEAQNGDAVHGRGFPSQRWVAPRVVRSGGSAPAGPGRPLR
jgi:hypothetical protein